MNLRDVTIGMRVKTVNQLMNSLGFYVVPSQLETRRQDAEGEVLGIYAGHGGDVWAVKHKNGSIAAYRFTEFERLETQGIAMPKATLQDALTAEETRLRLTLSEFRYFDQSVPAHIHDALVDWAVRHRSPGPFLTAVMRNDLAEACWQADDINGQHLSTICAWMHNHAPSGCFGSPAKVEAWRIP